MEWGQAGRGEGEETEDGRVQDRVGRRCCLRGAEEGGGDEKWVEVVALGGLVICGGRWVLNRWYDMYSLL